jgi:hypothetical protein
VAAATRSPAITRGSTRGAGAELRHLPPCSPDRNPIELAFAKLKALLRAAASRTVDVLWRIIGQLLDAFSPTERTNYLAHAGPPVRRARIPTVAWTTQVFTMPRSSWPTTSWFSRCR